MSYGYMKQEVERVREDIEVLVTQAYQQDEAEEAALGSRRGDALPAELARREDRLATIEAAMRRLEVRAKAEADAERQRRAEAEEAALGSRRGDELPAELARREDRLVQIEAAMRRLEAQAQAEADAERQRRAAAEAERQRTGEQRRGKVPKPVEDAPVDKAQSNFTDPELHIMQTNNKGWEYCGNAQVSVDATCQIILACDVTDASNDKQQAEPVAQATLATLAQAGIAPPKDASGAAQAIPATLDNGYDSETAAQALED